MIDIVKAGLLSTIQDLGRTGSRHLGVISAGALDSLALRVANRLVGNDDNAAAIEITVGLPFTATFRQATRIALCGADCHATLDGEPIHAWWSVPVAAGQTLSLHGSKQSMRTYLAVAGGVAVPALLGSRSTDLKTAFGGAEGRALAEGDTLPIGQASSTIPASADLPAFGVKSPAWCRLAFDGALPPAAGNAKPARGNVAAPLVVRVIPAGEYAMFGAEAQQALWQAEWTITPNSNRMGYRLSGPVLERTADAQGVDLLSHGVLPGTIQVPPNGQPIVLMGDAQTAGGYPKIGAVITADLWLLAQATLNTSIRFVPCTREEAIEAQRAVLRYLSQVDIAIAQRPVQRATKRDVKPASKPASKQEAPTAAATTSAHVTAATAPAPAPSDKPGKPSKAAKSQGKDKMDATAMRETSFDGLPVQGSIGDRIMSLSDDDAALPVSELVSELLKGVLKT